MLSFYIICFFTFCLHLSESLAYGMRISGIRTKQIAIALSFVSTTLLISRLSNMFQAPLLGSLADATIHVGTSSALTHFELAMRFVIFAAFLGSLVVALLTPTTVTLFEKAIYRFLAHGSLPKIFIESFKPKTLLNFVKVFRFPNFSTLSFSLKTIPKGFLILNIFVTAIWTIGVLCSLTAGAYLPEYRSTANLLSGIVNGMGTILLTVFVDPAGARITDQVVHRKRPQDDIKTVVFFLHAGRLFGILIVAQLLYKPFSTYIMVVTQWLTKLTIS